MLNRSLIVVRRLVLPLMLLFLALAAAPAPAQPLAPSAGRYRIEGVTTREQRSAIASAGAAIDAVGNNYVEITAPPAVRQRLVQLGFAIRPLSRTLDFPPADAAYHTYAEMVDEIHAVAAAHPAIVQLFSIGRSYEGRELWAAKVSDNAATDEDEPEALLVGQYHAREHLTVEMMLAILHMLAGEYDLVEPQNAITRLVDTREIYLIFSLNPDGSEYDIRDGMYHYWRKNRQPNQGSEAIGTDPNRNHAYRWGGPGSSESPDSEIFRGPAPASAPEVAAIQSFVDGRVLRAAQQISVAISFHTYGELILWPYGYTFDDIPADMAADDRAVFEALGRGMAERNGYAPMQSSDLYLTSGDFGDWAYGTHRIFAYTFEMHPCWGTGCPSYDFYPPGSVIPTETARNREAVLYLLEYAACPYAAIGKASQRCPSRTQTLPQQWLPLAG